MAKKTGNKKLYNRMRASGVRKRLARELSALPGIGSDGKRAPKPIRDALSQLQLAFVRIGGQSEAPEASAQGRGEPSQAPEPGPQAPPPPSAEPGSPEEGAGPAQRSGRLWIPGQ